MCQLDRASVRQNWNSHHGENRIGCFFSEVRTEFLEKSQSTRCYFVQGIEGFINKVQIWVNFIPKIFVFLYIINLLTSVENVKDFVDHRETFSCSKEHSFHLSLFQVRNQFVVVEVFRKFQAL